MKISQLEKIIRKAVKEEVKQIFQDELKEIIIESIKNRPQEVNYINENQSLPLPNLHSNPPKSREELRQGYANILNETANFNTSQFNGVFQPTSGIQDVENGALPSGEVPLEQILSLGKK